MVKKLCLAFLISAFALALAGELPGGTHHSTEIGDCIESDLGDAPDSVNHFGLTMEAYFGINALFPTVYQRGGANPGPLHHNYTQRFFLGGWISVEQEADLGYDQDGLHNIDPQANNPDRDDFDDGLELPSNFEGCSLMALDYVVTVMDPNGADVYVNVWLDWNRNGSWGDILDCPEGGVEEWAVKNQYLRLSGMVSHLLTTPAFYSGQMDEDMWVRITVSDSPAPSADGSGPPQGYAYGETEDYLTVPCRDYSISLVDGEDDTFSQANGPEPATPRPGLVAATTGSVEPDYDVPITNDRFIESFTNLNVPGYTICAASLHARMRPTGDIPENDAISFAFYDDKGREVGERWYRRIGPDGGVPGFQGTPWTGANFPNGTILVFDLANLPNQTGGPTNLLADLNANGFLDISMQDDTTFDYMELRITYCCE